MKIPLAWLQLRREKMRLFVVLAGIGFADILMFMQLGFRDALFDSAVTFHKNLQGDIFLISPQSTAIMSMKSFSSRRLYETLGFAGVKSVSPLYLDLALWKNPQTGGTRSILVLGFNPADSALNLPEIKSNLDTIKIPDVVLFDDASRPEYGAIGQQFRQGEDITTEVKGRRIKVGGLFTLGASFGTDGNLVTSDLNFLRIFPTRDQGLIDIGIITLEQDADIKEVLKSLKRELPEDVRVLSKEEFINLEENYWQTSTAIGFILTLSTGMGFIISAMMVYQIIYTDVSEHLPKYTTFKARGNENEYLLIVVLQEVIILAILGYLPGCSLAFGLYSLTKGATNLPMAMTLTRAIMVLILTIIMCCISGAIAVRKLQVADPTDIF